MCGIAGIAFFNGHSPIDMTLLKGMCDTLVHRGPDEEGIGIQDGVGFGMRRLSIIDLEGGKQPIFNEDGTIRTVFNGEIYNFRTLRRQLESEGHVFKTNTDTEVIVHAYEEFGAEFPKYLNGMFALALHDSARRKLFLARDHVGIKPLYYSFGRDSIVWGSEIKTVLASGLVERKLDADALGQFLSWEYIPGSSTLFKAIKKLEPAQLIEIDLERPFCKPRDFWDVPTQDLTEMHRPEEWEEEVNRKARECVQRQLMSDVPLGAFLSGGVDSSLVVAQMGKAKTFSIGFDDRSYNELEWARRVAAHLGVEHVDDIITPDVVGLFDTLMYFMDDPIGDFSIFPTYLVSAHARKHVTVALSGDGGDELFGGYETYLADAIARQYASWPSVVRTRVVEPIVRSFKPRPEKKGVINKALRFIEGFAQPDELAHARWRIFADDTTRQALFTPEALKDVITPASHHILDLVKRAGERDSVNKSLYVDLKSYLCDNCLVKVDRMSMAVSLEARVPYLDREMVELAFRIPGHLKVANGRTKILLKKVAAVHVPRECVYRPKEGFSIPIKNWLGTRLYPVMQELLEPGRIRRQGLFQQTTVERLKREHLSGAANHSHLLWSLMIFQAWRRRWLEG